MKNLFEIEKRGDTTVGVVKDYDFSRHKVDFSKIDGVTVITVDGKGIRDFLAPIFLDAGKPLPKDCNNIELRGCNFGEETTANKAGVSLDVRPSFRPTFGC